MKLNVLFNSAYDLKNVNWQYGDLQPYAVAWIDSGKKRSTKIDATNGENPVWNELITIPLPPTSHVETAILYTDIVHAKSAADMKPLIGSAKLPVRAILDKARSNGKASFRLILKRPSGRPQGELEIQIEIIDANINQREPYGQQPRYIPAQPQLQPQPRPQYQPQPMNQYPNGQGFVAPGYPVNTPQNLRPNLVQQPRNGMLMPRPQYRPVVNQQPSVASALCALTLGVTPNQIGRMVGSVKRMTVHAFNAPQPVNMGMLNNTGMIGNGGTNATYGNDPAADQGYINTTAYEGTTDCVGYDGSAFDGSQFGTDGALDLGGFDASGLEFGGEA